jgi:hypothetical protein
VSVGVSRSRGDRLDEAPRDVDEAEAAVSNRRLAGQARKAAAEGLGRPRVADSPSTDAIAAASSAAAALTATVSRSGFTVGHAIRRDRPLEPRVEVPAVSIATPEDVVRALERTLATGSARVVVIQIARFFMPPAAEGPAGRSRRHGGIVRPLLRSAGGLGKVLLDRVTAGGRLTIIGRGVIDFGHRRSMVAYGRESVIVVDGEARTGPPGLPVAVAPARPAGSLQDPTWLLNAAYGVTAVEARGADRVVGEACRRLRIVCDLSRAAAATPAQLALPFDIDRFEELLHVPLDVWVDQAGFIRRVHHESRHRVAMTLDLLELGVELPGDWTRLPRTERR